MQHNFGNRPHLYKLHVRPVVSKDVLSESVHMFVCSFKHLQGHVYACAHAQRYIIEVEDMHVNVRLEGGHKADQAMMPSPALN